MDRLTIPDVKLDAHTTRRTMIDGEAVRERAMEIYWRLKDYEDTGLTPAEIHSMYGEWNAMMSVLNSIGSYDRLRELAEADKEGRVGCIGCPMAGLRMRLKEFADYPKILWIILAVGIYRDRCAWNKRIKQLTDELEEVLERDREND